MLDEQDETQNQTEDTSQGAEDSSREEKGTTSGQDTTISKKAAEKMVSDAKAEAGRVQKQQADQISLLTQEKESANQRLNEVTETVNALRQQIREAKLTGAKDDPNLAKLIRSEHEAEDLMEQATAKMRQAEAKETAANAKLAEIEKTSHQTLINTLAAQYGVKAEKLEGFGVTNPEKLTELAKALGRKRDTTGDKGDKDEDSDDEKLDSLTGSGSGDMSVEQLDQDDMATFAAKRQKQSPDIFPVK